MEASIIAGRLVTGHVYFMANRFQDAEVHFFECHQTATKNGDMNKWWVVNFAYQCSKRLADIYKRRNVLDDEQRYFLIAHDLLEKREKLKKD